MLLIDLMKWRKERLGERAAAYVRQQAGRLRYPDQDALNVAVDGRWLELDESWNFEVRDEMDPSHALRALQPLRRIVHFPGGWKPWSSDQLEGEVKREYLRRAKRLGFGFGR